MTRKYVKSSMINDIGYDRNILEVGFHNNSVYQYYGVSENLFKDLMNASSHGKFFHNHIRDIYNYKRVM
ncbi:MAG: KTSC domain-containing protein [Alphaproteobacteria bacterium]|nr:KTSC domain-containing protein [Alphaproteobacteria bacterium]